MEDEELTLEGYKKRIKRTADELFYPAIVQKLIDKCETVEQVTRVMRNARDGVYAYE